MVTGISTACFFGTTPLEDSIDRIGNLGIQTIEVFLNTTSEYEEDFAYRLRDRIDRYGMRVTSIHPQGTQFEPQLFSSYARSVGDSMLMFRKVLRAGQILGARNYIFHGGMHFKPAVKNRVDQRKNAAIIDRLSDLAGEYGIRLAHENVHWCWFHTPEYAKELLERIKTKNLYFNLDVKQAAQSGIDPLIYLGVMGKRLVNIHLCDFVRRDEYVLPCEMYRGDMDFVALRKRLEEINYSGNVILELYRDNFSTPEDLLEKYRKTEAFFQGIT